jgi:hypothetical protein
MLTNHPPVPVIFAGDFSLEPATQIPSLTVRDTIPGCRYRLVYTEDLATPTWNPVTPPLPSGWQTGGGILVFTDSSAPGKSQRFYRVEAQ